MVRLVKLGALAAALTFVATACSSSVVRQQPSSQAGLQRGGVFKIGLASDVHQALDPAWAEDTGNAALMGRELPPVRCWRATSGSPPGRRN